MCVRMQPPIRHIRDFIQSEKCIPAASPRHPQRWGALNLKRINFRSSYNVTLDIDSENAKNWTGSDPKHPSYQHDDGEWALWQVGDHNESIYDSATLLFQVTD